MSSNLFIGKVIHQFPKNGVIDLTYSCIVTRFGEILPLGHNINILGNFLRVYLVFGILLKLIWQILNAIGQIFIDVNGQKLKKNLTIWSHCTPALCASLEYPLHPFTLFFYGNYDKRLHRKNFLIDSRPVVVDSKQKVVDKLVGNQPNYLPRLKISWLKGFWNASALVRNPAAQDQIPSHPFTNAFQEFN